MNDTGGLADEEPASSDEADAAANADDEADRSNTDAPYASLTKLGGAQDEPLDLGLDQVDPSTPQLASEPAPEPSPAIPEAKSEANPNQDELLLDADRLADEDGQVAPRAGGRRRGLVSGGGDSTDGAGAGDSNPSAGGSGPSAGGNEEPSGGASAPGTTLFERMASLSRTSKSDDEEEDEGEEDSGSSINIPRFLGRQNNQ